MKIPKIYNIFKGQIAKIFFWSEIIHENMQKIYINFRMPYKIYEFWSRNKVEVESTQGYW